MRRFVFTLLLASSPALMAQQQDFSKVEIRTQQVAPGVHMLIGAGGNLGVSSGEDGVFLIDDQFEPLAPKIRAAVEAISKQPVRFVINTHWHGDHTGGNEAFGKSGSVIVAHDNVRKRMSVEQFVQRFNRRLPPSPKAALPVITFSEGVTFHLNGETLEVFHLANAHTDGDGVIWFKNANVLHTGDLFFNGMYPFIDVDSGGSLDGMIAAADRLLAMTNVSTKIIPGHGALATRADYRAFRDMLVTVRDRIAKLIAEGKSVDQVVAAAPLQDLGEKWGKGFMKTDTFTKIVASDLSRGRATKAKQ